MEKQLLQLGPRTRTTEQQKKTLHSIQRLVKKEKKKEWLKIASSYVGIAAILFLLFTIAVNPVSTTTSSGKEIKYVGFLTYEIKPWYYINAGHFTLNKEGVQNIAELVALADKGKPFELDSTNLIYEFQISQYYVGATMEKEEAVYILLKPFDLLSPYYFINNESNTYTQLSPEEFQRIQPSIETFSDDYKTLPTSARLLIVVMIYLAYLWGSRRLSSEAPLNHNNIIINTLGKSVLIVVSLYILGFLVSALSDDLNIITAFIILSLASFGRYFLENFDRYSKSNWLQVPLTIFVYTLNLFILFYN